MKVFVSMLLCIFSSLSFAYTLMIEDDTFSDESAENLITNKHYYFRRRLDVLNLNEDLPGWKKGERIAFLKFNLNSVPKGLLSENVHYASLRFFISGVIRPGYLGVYDVSQAWEENSVNWTNQPEVGRPVAWALVNQDHENRWLELNITNAVKRWINNPEANFGVALRAPTPGSVPSAWVMIDTKEGNYDHDNIDSRFSNPGDINFAIERQKALSPETIYNPPSGHPATIEVLFNTMISD